PDAAAARGRGAGPGAWRVRLRRRRPPRHRRRARRGHGFGGRAVGLPARRRRPGGLAGRHDGGSAGAAARSRGLARGGRGAAAMSRESLDSFIDKWRARWPEWGIAEAFLARPLRTPVAAWFSLLQELHDAAWAGAEPAPGLAKLAWWQEELRGWSRGARRHPLGEALQRLDADWDALGQALARLPATREPLTPGDGARALPAVAAGAPPCAAAWVARPRASRCRRTMAPGPCRPGRRAYCTARRRCSAAVPRDRKDPDRACSAMPCASSGPWRAGTSTPPWPCGPPWRRPQGPRWGG